MLPSLLQIETSIQISKTPAEVFEAIVNPEKMCNYFISESTGRMQAMAQLVWRFPEFDINIPVSVDKIIQNEYISFYWDGANSTKLLVEFALKANSDHTCVISAKEGSMKCDEAGIAWLKNNTQGWANFLACLKAYMEYGINLRKGAFDFMRTPQLS